MSSSLAAGVSSTIPLFSKDSHHLSSLLTLILSLYPSPLIGFVSLRISFLTRPRSHATDAKDCLSVVVMKLFSLPGYCVFSLDLVKMLFTTVLGCLEMRTL